MFDLLDAAGAGADNAGLHVREGTHKGVYVENLTEELVHSPTDASTVCMYECMCEFPCDVHVDNVCVIVWMHADTRPRLPQQARR